MTDKEKELQAEAIDYYRRRIAELEKENAELHSKIGCYQKGMAMETNKRDIKITEAKEIINAFLDFESSAMERGCYIADDTRRRAEDFIKEQEMKEITKVKVTKETE